MKLQAKDAGGPRAVSVRLTAAHEALARKYGEGEISQGIRTALERLDALGGAQTAAGAPIATSPWRVDVEDLVPLFREYWPSRRDLPDRQQLAWFGGVLERRGWTPPAAMKMAHRLLERFRREPGELA